MRLAHSILAVSAIALAGSAYAQEKPQINRPQFHPEDITYLFDGKEKKPSIYLKPSGFFVVTDVLKPSDNITIRSDMYDSLNVRYESGGPYTRNHVELCIPDAKLRSKVVAAYNMWTPPLSIKTTLSTAGFDKLLQQMDRAVNGMKPVNAKIAMKLQATRDAVAKQCRPVELIG